MLVTAVGKFVKDKLFSTTGIFLLIFAAIFAVFLFSNSNVILSKFGFETTTNLKSELTRVQNELRQLQAINNGLNKTIEDLQKRNTEVEEALVKSFIEKETLREKVNDIRAKKDKKVKELNKRVEEQTTVTETTITLPIVEIDQLSAENIDSLNEVYDSLFSEGG